MAETCAPLGCPQFVRLSRQDACTGAPIPGATNGVFWRCGRNVTLEAVVQDAEESVFTSDCGVPDRYVQDSYINGYTLTVEVANFSPQTKALLRGEVLITDVAVNVGTIEVSAAGCTTGTTIPTFIAELFYQVRSCVGDVNVNYFRVIVGGVKFAPPETDKEGQITFQRWIGTSQPARTQGLVEDGNAGPYNDIPTAVETDLLATSDTQQYTKVSFFELNNTISTFATVADTCYVAVVPAFPT